MRLYAYVSVLLMVAQAGLSLYEYECTPLETFEIELNQRQSFSISNVWKPTEVDLNTLKKLLINMRDMKPSEQTIKDAVGKMSSTFDSDQRILACASMLNSESVEKVGQR